MERGNEEGQELSSPARKRVAGHEWESRPGSGRQVAAEACLSAGVVKEM